MNKSLSYIPKLDSLRAMAAIIVVMAHFLVDLNWVNFPYGANGVQVFFVISGFLITTILLAQKHAQKNSTGVILKNFIIRRSLRLFPIYYLLLIVLFAISFVGGLWICDRSDIIYYFTYTQNYLFYIKGFQSPLLNHTWSLAVEEQFYLFWPLLLMLTPKRHELKLIFFIFLFGILYKALILNQYTGPGTSKGVTFQHFDTLGSGALLAYCIFYKKELILSAINKMYQPVLVISLLLTLFLDYIGFNDRIFAPLCLNIMSLSFVYATLNTSSSFIDPLLNLKILQHLGKISYGIYLYHKPIPFFFSFISSRLNIHIDNKYILLSIFLLITYLISLFSWKFIESPVAKLKEKFEN